MGDLKSSHVKTEQTRTSVSHRVGRFQVMALLQAARAFELGLPLVTAQSWGLNRAIFYAAAKRGFKSSKPKTGFAEPKRPHPLTGATLKYKVGEEVGFVSPGSKARPLFVIGGEPQTPRDFEKQVTSRFNGKFDSAWAYALAYVRHFDRETLSSGQEFFSSVYKPVRDELATKWTSLAEEGFSPNTSKKQGITNKKKVS